MNIEKVGVIGGGISGLVAAKTLLEQGYDVTVFEQRQGIGGVWEKSKAYLGLTTQSTKDTYCFSDYPMPASYPEFLTAENVRNYLESYAQQFGVMERIRFQTEVINLSRNQESGWVLRVKVKNDRALEIEQKHEFDFVLICNGTFNTPHIPALPGQEEFIASSGKVLHSTHFQDISLINGKQLVVVGFGKSACEIAAISSNTAKECTLVFRRTLWKIPKYFFNRINYKRILLTRFAEIWLHYRKPVGVETWLHNVGKPLVWAFWRLNEMLMRRQFDLDACGLLPNVAFDKSLSCNAQIVPDNFYDCVRSGKIKVKKTSIARFITGGVELANGDRLQADVVIFGTGFRQNIPFLEEKYRRQVMDDQGNFHLYRHLIHPNVPNMGFIGYNSSLFCPLTSEVGAWWLAEHIKGNLNLPDKTQMLQEMKAHFSWSQANLPFQVLGTCVAPFGFHYLEELLEDMGFGSYGQGKKQIQGIMETVNPLAYGRIRQELRAKGLSGQDGSMEVRIR